ncbi:MAG TPA: hypothetical protein VLA71_12970 [Algoriphagus sp.]|nr:hypothetical protein [Algoriphagus sp.]
MNNKFKAIFFLLAISTSSYAQEESKPATTDAAELAKKLANPVASLISLPFQNNLDVGIGEYNGSRNTLNIQPVIPVTISPKMNLITRVILPVISQYDIYSEGSSQTGLSDVLASAFFAPSESKNGVIWGAGPAFLIPTATDDLLGAKKFGVGPTALLLRQTNGWTYGALVNQIWSIAGADDRPDVNQMFLQPFINYNWKSGAGIGINSEITQNWEGSTTSVFINPTLSGVTKLGKQVVSLVVGPRIQVAAVDGNKAEFGVRSAITFVFPK